MPPLFDVVLLLEAMLAVEDQDALIRAIAAALRPGGRFAFTLEEGAPLTTAERAVMPDAGTVWLPPLDEMTGCLDRAGLVVTSVEDHSAEHRATAQALIDAYAADAAAITAQLDRRGSRTCSPPTGCGSSGWQRAGCASSRWWPSLRGRSAGSRPPGCRSEGRRAHREHPPAGEQHALGDLVDDAVADRVVVGERHRAAVVDEAGDLLVDVDEQRVDGAVRRRARDLGDVRGGAALGRPLRRRAPGRRASSPA